MAKFFSPARCLFAVVVAVGLGGANGAFAQDLAHELPAPPSSSGEGREGWQHDDEATVDGHAESVSDSADSAVNDTAATATDDSETEANDTSVAVGSPEPAQEDGSGDGSDASVGAGSPEPDAPEADARIAPVSVELMLGTNAPLDVSLGARLVLFERLMLGASVGRSAYGNLAGNIAGAIGGDEVALIVEPVFSNAWVFRLNVGVRPFGVQGPELTVGYARMNSLATWDAATFSLPNSVGSLSADIGLNLLTVELGWSINVYGPVFLRPAVGWTQVRGASVSLSSSTNTSAQVATALESAEVIAEETLVDYGQTPTLSLTVGARF